MQKYKSGFIKDCNFQNIFTGFVRFGLFWIYLDRFWIGLENNSYVWAGLDRFWYVSVCVGQVWIGLDGFGYESLGLDRFG